MVKDIAVGAGDLRFNSRASCIGHSVSSELYCPGVKPQRRNPPID